MRALVKFYRIQYLLGKIGETFLDEKVSENKITVNEKNDIMS